MAMNLLLFHTNCHAEGKDYVPKTASELKYVPTIHQALQDLIEHLTHHPGGKGASKARTGASSGAFKKPSRSAKKRSSGNRTQFVPTPDGGTEGNGEEDGNDQGALSPPPEAEALPEQLVFACPAYKHDFWHNMECWMRKNFNENTRITQHIKREACPSLSDEQRERVRGLRLVNSSSPVENWYRIYRVLYPGEQVPESPYREVFPQELFTALQNRYRENAANITDATFAKFSSQNPHLAELVRSQRMLMLVMFREVLARLVQDICRTPPMAPSTHHPSTSSQAEVMSTPSYLNSATAPRSSGTMLGSFSQPSASTGANQDAWLSMRNHTQQWLRESSSHHEPRNPGSDGPIPDSTPWGWSSPVSPRYVLQLKRTCFQSRRHATK
ncbi:hypothetical protein M8818_004964 [Zalaria obscura]|uniref:Uncharacterized protein n=1 Tax=Zalaria obscura TaxID=2024903 RepID=A0ACC3SB22_9PEZI